MFAAINKHSIYLHHLPEFIKPLTMNVDNSNPANVIVELTCWISGNPDPRCLFYKNDVAIPVVFIPSLVNKSSFISKIKYENQMTTSSQNSNFYCCILNSFSNKYTFLMSEQNPIDSNHYQHQHQQQSMLKLVTLQIHNFSTEIDTAVYSCRVWNYLGRNINSLDLNNKGFYFFIFIL